MGNRLEGFKQICLSSASSDTILYQMPILSFVAIRQILERAAPWCIPQHNPAFVKSIKEADKAEPEASFDNVEDMMEWLEEDGTISK